MPHRIAYALLFLASILKVSAHAAAPDTAVIHPAGISDSRTRFAVGANYYALTYHPGGGQSVDYPRKLDDDAVQATA